MFAKGLTVISLVLRGLLRRRRDVVVDAERKARRKGLTRKRRHDPRSGEASARRERRSIGGWGVWRAYEGALDDSNVSSIVR
jgi:hypothetical protein